MGQFSYKAVDRGGAHVAGVVDAADRRSAVATLTGRGHLVMELIEKGQGHERRGIAGGRRRGLQLSGVCLAGADGGFRARTSAP